MSVKFPILAIKFDDDCSQQFIDEWFQKHPDLTTKYQKDKTYSQIKSYYPTELEIKLEDKVIAQLHTKKLETRLEKCKPRGALIKLGRPKKQQQASPICGECLENCPHHKQAE